MADERFRVLILGYGEIGHAVAHLLQPRHAISIWQRRPSDNLPAIDLAETAANSDFVFFCLPAQAHANLATRLQAKLTDRTACVTVAKGLDDQGRLPVEVFREILPGIPCGALYGPMIAEEVRAGRPAFAQFASDNGKSIEAAARLFAGSTLAIERGGIPIVTSWLAVLKNVYAMLFGLAEEWALGDNARGFLTVAAMREMEQIVFDRTGTRPPAHQLAGLGDLVTTGTSAGSHHRELGRRIARGDGGVLEGEGVHTLAMLRSARLVDLSRYPLARLLDSALRKPGSLSRAMFEDYLRTQVRGRPGRDALA